MKLRKDYPLTAKQEIIAHSPVNYPQVVLAAPGTGKTHIVAARIWYLIEKYELEPSEILVLCFSRAAVREVINRLQSLVRKEGTHDDLRFVSVRTFDSFATRLLLVSNPALNLQGHDYDSRIKLLVGQLSEPASEASTIIAGVRHLIVDEIQDLVGARADLVRGLIQRISGGFTLLGDPAQAIYGFSVQNQPNAANLDTLLVWLRQQSWIHSLTERDVAENHRSTGPVAQIAAQLRNALVENSTQTAGKLSAIRETVQGLDTVGDGAIQALGSEDQSICVLCRTNGEVLQIASKLSTLGIGFQLRPNHEDHALPAWLGRVLGGCNSSRLSHKAFDDRWQELVQAEGQPEPTQAWNWLKRIEGQSSPDLDLYKLQIALRRGSAPPDDMDAFMDSGARNGLSLSTIHAAKGREFDKVIILDQDQSRLDINHLELEEARVLYVAATRARKVLNRIGRSGLPRAWKITCGSHHNRWVSQQSTGSYMMEAGLRTDFDPVSTISDYVFRTRSDVQQSQEYIWAQVRPNDPITIFSSRAGQCQFYQVFHRSTPDMKYAKIGRMSFSFKTDLEDVLRKSGTEKEVSGPDYMYGAQVTAVVTELLPPYPDHAHQPYATTGFCLGVRFRGMMTMGWRR